jgi:hypothetical protein
VPFPGDGRVLWPNEVTPAVESEEEELEGSMEPGGEETEDVKPAARL